jgi:S-adenosylmethionine:tRNA ribosyltransferase-isomerase
VAAPTAGFHLTEPIRDQLRRSGIQICEITLHVGLGTFLPIKSEMIEDHVMHPEWVELPQTTADAVLKAKSEGRRVIAVGTTCVRALEGVAERSNGTLRSYRGDIDLFIRPGFQFRVIDGMLTNFHLPASSLIVLVSAFAGRERILTAYKRAVSMGYRFYSFGDTMLILKN